MRSFIHIDVGCIEIFLSTKKVDLSSIPHSTPFDASCGPRPPKGKPLAHHTSHSHVAQVPSFLNFEFSITTLPFGSSAPHVRASGLYKPFGSTRDTLEGQITDIYLLKKCHSRGATCILPYSTNSVHLKHENQWEMSSQPKNLNQNLPFVEDEGDTEDFNSDEDEEE
jgi:hypothetical protein